MDQVRKILAAIGKYHFWLLCVLVAFVAIIGWKLASTALSEQFEQYKGQVGGYFGNLRSVTGDPKHPNEKINDALNRQTAEQKKLVLARWQALYDAQRNDVLRWPDFGPFFADQGDIYKLKFGDKIEDSDLRRYQNRVQALFQEKFPKIVKASSASLTSSSTGWSGSGRTQRWLPRGDVRASDAGSDVEDYLVQWDDYDTILGKLRWEQTPTPLKVWLTQEDLWVYQTLLSIVANTNKDANGPHDAVVKRIMRLEVGQDAATESDTQKRLTPPQSTAGGEGAAGGVSRSEEGAGKSASLGEGARGGDLPPEALDNLLLENRYQDEKGEPLAADSVLAPSANGGIVNPFKRLPVRLALEMDVRKLELLLVECANAALPVEVQQVRINPDQSGSGYRGGFRMSGGKGEGGIAQSIGRSNIGGTEGQIADPAIVPVVIQGTIYIYNPPDKRALGLTDEEPPQA